jgi:hypothetical protein
VPPSPPPPNASKKQGRRIRLFLVDGQPRPNQAEIMNWNGKVLRRIRSEAQMARAHSSDDEQDDEQDALALSEAVDTARPSGCHPLGEALTCTINL